jgi:hypothetical protein
MARHSPCSSIQVLWCSGILARWDAEAKSGVGPCRWETPAARVKLAKVTGRKQIK